MQTTVANMLAMLERPFGRKVSRDRAYLLEMANRIRQNFYNLYREYEMEVDVTECFELQKFGTCHDCPDGYYGVTLPAHMNTVEAAWASGVPMDLYSKWREAKVGIKPAKDCMVACYDRPGTYPTERDIAASGGSYVSVVNTEAADNGKAVEVTYVGPAGDRKRESLTLTAGQPISTLDVATKILSVVLPSSRIGTIRITENCSGRILSEYLPFETVPSYRRVKITGSCPCGQVLITANRQFQPVYYDTDIVETDNQEAIVNAALHIFYASSGAEGGTIVKAQFHEQLMKAALKGEASRNIGVNRENDTGRFGPPVRRSRLHRTSRAHNILN